MIDFELGDYGAPFTETPIDDERGSSDSEDIDKLLTEYEKRLADNYTSPTDP